MREVVNGLMYILSTACQWRAIPKDLPPRSTLYDYFDLWSWDGTLDRIHDALYAQCRQAASREASPTAAIIDSQSVKSAEKGACDRSARVQCRQEDQGKKRNILVDTQGLPMHAVVRAADLQDREGGALVIASLFGAFPFLIKLYADGGYQGPEFRSAMKRILRASMWRSPSARIKSEASAFAWLGRCRRPAKDWECLNHKALAFLRLASIRLMLRKLCNPHDVLGQTLRTMSR